MQFFPGCGRRIVPAAAILLPLAMLLADPVAAEGWAARRTAFALAAVGETKIAPNAPASTWNVLAVGLFCGPRTFNPGRINLYVYGIDADRMASGRPLEGTIEVDGARTDLTLRSFDDVMAAPIAPELARKLMTAQSASIFIKDYQSPKPDPIEMAGAGPAIQRALRACLK